MVKDYLKFIFWNMSDTVKCIVFEWHCIWLLWYYKLFSKIVFIIPEIKQTILYKNTDITFVEIFFFTHCDELWFRSLPLYVMHKHMDQYIGWLCTFFTYMIVIQLQCRSFDWPESSTWKELWTSHAFNILFN